MATFNTVWSLDVGKTALKAVKLRRERNNIEILAVDKIDYPIAQNGADTGSQAKEAISAFRIRNDVKEPVIVAHNGQGTLSRFIKVPAFEPKKVKEMVGYEASQQIPFPLDEVVWDYHVIQRDYLPGEEREVGLFAARRETIDDYLLDFTSEDLAVEGLTIGYLGLLNYVFFDLAPEEPAIILDIGGSHTDLILIDGRKFWIRSLPHSGTEISRAIMDRLRLGYAEAEKLKVEIAKNPKQAAKVFQAIIQPKLAELVNSIHQSIGFYRTQVGETQFKQLYLLGNASRVVGIKKFFEDRLSVAVHRVSTINHLRINRDVDVQTLQSNLPAFATAFGVALQGVGAGACQVDLIPQEEKLEKEYQRKKIHVFIAVGILFLATLLAGFLVRQKKENAEDALVQAQGVVKPLDKLDKEIKKIKAASIDKQKEMLLDVARYRTLPFEGAAILGQVLDTLPNEASVSKIAEGDLKQLLQEAQETALAQMKEKLWITNVEISKIQWPLVDDQPGGGGGARGKKKKRGPTVPAYQMKVFAIVVQEASALEALDSMKERLQKPLERYLKASKLTLDTVVQVSTEFKPGLKHILKPTAGRNRDLDDVLDQGNFAGVELTWYFRDREPPKVTEEPKDAGGKKKRGKGKKSSKKKK